MLRGILWKQEGGKLINMNNKMLVTIYLSIITLNENVWNALKKRHRVDECLRKKDPCIWYLWEKLTSGQMTHRLKVKGWKKFFHTNENEKKKP